MRAHLTQPDITLTQLAAELDREAGRRASLYPERVSSARMTQREADFQIACCNAWRADVARMIACWGTPQPMAPATHGIRWSDRRAALQREIDMRRRYYPDWIASGRLTQDRADRQLACTLALAAIYDDGFDWIASNGERPHFHMVDGVTSAIAQARKEWDGHLAAITDRANPATQGEMAI